MCAAKRVSGFSRIVHVLRTITSACSCDAASPSPSSSSMPLIRSESWAFIWHPNVVTWYLFTARRVARLRGLNWRLLVHRRVRRSRMVLGYVDGAALADHRHLYLAGVFETILDLAGDLVREECGC